MNSWKLCPLIDAQQVSIATCSSSSLFVCLKRCQNVAKTRDMLLIATSDELLTHCAPESSIWNLRFGVLTLGIKLGRVSSDWMSIKLSTPTMHAGLLSTRSSND